MNPYAFFMTQMAKLAANHPLVLAYVITPVVLAVLNLLIPFFTSKKWNQILLNSPRLAGFMTILKGFGIVPETVFKGFFLIFAKRPWTPPEPSEEEKIAAAAVSSRVTIAQDAKKASDAADSKKPS